MLNMSINKLNARLISAIGLFVVMFGGLFSLASAQSINDANSVANNTAKNNNSKNNSIGKNNRIGENNKTGLDNKTINNNGDEWINLNEYKNIKVNNETRMDIENFLKKIGKGIGQDKKVDLKILIEDYKKILAGIDAAMLANKKAESEAVEQRIYGNVFSSLKDKFQDYKKSLANENELNNNGLDRVLVSMNDEIRDKIQNRENEIREKLLSEEYFNYSIIAIALFSSAAWMLLGLKLMWLKVSRKQEDNNERNLRDQHSGKKDNGFVDSKKKKEDDNFIKFAKDAALLQQEVQTQKDLVKSQNTRIEEYKNEIKKLINEKNVSIEIGHVDENIANTAHQLPVPTKNEVDKADSIPKRNEENPSSIKVNVKGGEKSTFSTNCEFEFEFKDINQSILNVLRQFEEESNPIVSSVILERLNVALKKECEGGLKLSTWDGELKREATKLEWYFLRVDMSISGRYQDSYVYAAPKKRYVENFNNLFDGFLNVQNDSKIKTNISPAKIDFLADGTFHVIEKGAVDVGVF
jgi:hypothetical protein